MKKRNLAALPVLLLAVIVSCSEPAVQRNGDTRSFGRLCELFASPPAEYGTVPFWVWNDEVTEKEIDLQLKELTDAGAGGVFIHPRPGLVTPYLSDRWFELCEYSVQKAEELGILVWLYDENSYPSGFAGGHVPAVMPESYEDGQGLVMKKVDTLPDPPEDNTYLVLKKDGDSYTDITVNADDYRGKRGNYCIFIKTFYPKSPWYGGFSYVDLLKEGVTEKFIEVTMSGYERTIGSHFGKLVPGVFTDEPHISPPGRGSIKWTPDLFDAFEQRWGYDLVQHLPSLYEETGDWKKIRYNYYGLLLDLFIERWSKPWYRYCEGKGLSWTGHYWEHAWPSPQFGGDNMAMYAWHQVPAIDILMNEYNEGVHAQFGNVRAVRELSSVASQLGRKRTLSETYGAGGWDLRFEDMKRIGDWEYVLGVNLMNQHLSYMTIEGARKRDHPLSFTYHNPWWPHYRILGDYFARLSCAMSYGEQHNHVLVIEPTSTCWMYFSPVQSNNLHEETGNLFQSLLNDLDRMQVEYDLGSENIIRDHGAVSGNRFVVGARQYDLVVIPPNTETLDRSTAELMMKYLASGGTVIALCDAPSLIDGAESDMLRSLASEYPERWITASSPDESRVKELLTSSGVRFADSGASGGKLFHHRRRLADGDLLFLVNTSLDEHAKGSFETAGKTLCELDLITGKTLSYPGERLKKNVRVAFDIEPAGSLLLFVSHKKLDMPDLRIQYHAEQSVEPAGNLTAERIAPNVLTLDYCDVRAGKKRAKNAYFFNAADLIFKENGLDGNPWSSAVQYKTNILDKNTFPAQSGFTADFYFRAAENVDTAGLAVVVERPELWTVAINGTTVRPREGEYWLDRAFGIFDIGSHAVAGKNTITLHAAHMTIHSELESIYLLGEFGLKSLQSGWELVPDRRLTAGSWSAQGLPFYSDGVSYSRTYRMSPAEGRYVVRLGTWNGCVASVIVNGKEAGIIGWQPWEADITGLVKDGENTVEVIVYGTLKNLLGPHHNNPPRGRAWPGMFQSGPDTQPPGSDYYVIGYGLFEDFTVVHQKQ